MKTILVTGAAGYIGRHVVKKALDMGYRVIASDFAFKGVDERAEFCDVPIFSGDKNIYGNTLSPFLAGFTNSTRGWGAGISPAPSTKASNPGLSSGVIPASTTPLNSSSALLMASSFLQRWVALD